MSEFEILQKAYNRLEEVYHAKEIECYHLKQKVKNLISKKKELEQLVEAHARLNRELIDLKKKKMLQNEKRRRSYSLKRQEMAQTSTQTNEKG